MVITEVAIVVTNIGWLTLDISPTSLQEGEEEKKRKIIEQKKSNEKKNYISIIIIMIHLTLL